MSHSINLDPNHCWAWPRAKAGNGYGVLTFFKRKYYVHRLAYRLFVGEIAGDLFVCHKCDNPECFNPNHLFLGTAKDNVRDMIQKGRNYRGGATNPKYQFSDDVVVKIRTDFESGIMPKELRATYNISNAQLYRITRYRTRPHLRPEGKSI